MNEYRSFLRLYFIIIQVILYHILLKTGSLDNAIREFSLA